MASVINMEEAFPSRFLPKPSSVSQLELLKGSYDPTLIATPERRLPTIVPLGLQRPLSSSSLFPADDSLCGRVTRVHFDQNVAVHHISPEGNNSSGSMVNCYPTSAEDNGMRCPELDLTNLSDSEPISVIASDLRNSSSALTSSVNTSGGFDTKSISDVASISDRQQKRKSAEKLHHKSNSGNGYSIGWNKKADIETIKQQHEETGSLVDGGAIHRSRPSMKSRSEANNHKRIVSPVVVSEIGSTEGLYSADPVRSAVSTLETQSQSLLARPELNSTLRLSREIEQLKDETLGASAILKNKMNPKMKIKIAEKAYSKLNAETIMYPDLIGIDVSETDLLSRVVEEQSSRAKICEVAEKAEDKISRIPDVMDFFAADLHKEFPSVSVIAVTPIRLEPRTAELNRAFDLYRHIRTWEKL